MEKAAIQDSLILQLEVRNSDLLLLQQFKDTTIVHLEQKTSNQSLLLQNKDQAYADLQQINKKLFKKSKRRGLKNGVLGGALLIITGILIAQ